MKCFGDKDKLYHCRIVLLDEQEILHEAQEATLGQAILDAVCQHLNLLETSYFGLRYIDPSNQTHWLDATKKISKQLKGNSPFVLYFSVKFYAADPTKLVEEITRYQFFLQIKQDILQGRLPVSMEMAAELGSLAVQSELGDYDPRRHSPGYISEFRFLPNQSIFIENQIEELHKKLIGQVPAKAELNYLEKVKWLDMYGVDLHPVLGEDSTEYFLGLTPTGIIVLRNKTKAGNYFWPRITKVYFRGKFFMLRVKDKNNFENTYGFATPSKGACKHLWRCCVEHHAFFRLTQAAENNPQAIFSLGSKFRYSGRTETQVQQDAKVKGRSQIEFSRSPSRRYQRRNSEAERKPNVVESDTRNVVLLPAHATTMPHIYRTTSPSTLPRESSPRSVRSAPHQPYDQSGQSSHDREATSGRESRTMTRGVSSTSIKSNNTSHNEFPQRAPSVDSHSSVDSRSRRHRHRRRSRGRSSDGESETSSKGSSRCHRRHHHRHRHSSNESTDSKHRRRHHRHRNSDKMVESSSQWAQIQERQNASKGHTATVRNLSNGYIPSCKDTNSSRSPRRRHRKNRSPSEGKKKYLPEEVRPHIEFDLKGTEGLSEWQLREIPYTKIESGRTSAAADSQISDRHNRNSSSMERSSHTGSARIRSRNESNGDTKVHSRTPIVQNSPHQDQERNYQPITKNVENCTSYPDSKIGSEHHQYGSNQYNTHYTDRHRDPSFSEQPYLCRTESIESGYPPSYSNGNINPSWRQQTDSSPYDSQSPPLKPQPSPQSSVTSGISMGGSSVSTANYKSTQIDTLHLYQNCTQDDEKLLGLNKKEPYYANSCGDMTRKYRSRLNKANSILYTDTSCNEYSECSPSLSISSKPPTPLPRSTICPKSNQHSHSFYSNLNNKFLSLPRNKTTFKSCSSSLNIDENINKSLTLPRKPSSNTSQQISPSKHAYNFHKLTVCDVDQMTKPDYSPYQKTFNKSMILGNDSFHEEGYWKVVNWDTNDDSQLNSRKNKNISTEISTALNDSGDADNSDSIHRNNRIKAQSRPLPSTQNTVQRPDPLWNTFKNGAHCRTDMNDGRTNAVSHIVIKEHGKEPRYISYVNSDATPPPLPPRQDSSSSVYLTNNQNNMVAPRRPILQEHRQDIINHNKPVMHGVSMYSEGDPHKYNNNNKMINYHNRRPDVKQVRCPSIPKNYQNGLPPTPMKSSQSIKPNSVLPEEVRTEL